jgi:hypothetical protein
MYIEVLDLYKAEGEAFIGSTPIYNPSSVEEAISEALSFVMYANNIPNDLEEDEFLALGLCFEVEPLPNEIISNKNAYIEELEETLHKIKHKVYSSRESNFKQALDYVWLLVVSHNRYSQYVPKRIDHEKCTE